MALSFVPSLLSNLSTTAVFIFALAGIAICSMVCMYFGERNPFIVLAKSVFVFFAIAAIVVLAVSFIAAADYSFFATVFELIVFGPALIVAVEFLVKP